MTSQYELIARKQEVRERIERTRRSLAQERSRQERASQRRVRKLEDELEKLMAEEYRLRLRIDQSR